jgi:hypothetical protein
MSRFLNVATALPRSLPPPLLILIHKDPTRTEALAVEIAALLRAQGYSVVRSVCPESARTCGPYVMHTHPHIVQACHHHLRVHTADRWLFVVNC